MELRQSENSEKDETTWEGFQISFCHHQHGWSRKMMNEVDKKKWDHLYWLVKGSIHLVLWSVIWVHHLPHSGLGPLWRNRRSLAWGSRCSACRWCKASHNALLPSGTKSERKIQMFTIFQRHQNTQQNQWKYKKNNDELQ